jgi:uncharacterized protein (DUF427 family)
MAIVVRERGTGEVLARGELGTDVVKYDGNLYFVPEAVEGGCLSLTERSGTCPYKGTYRWVDFAGPAGAAIQGVAWVYEQPKSAHAIIAGRYGFYPGRRGATEQTEE